MSSSQLLARMRARNSIGETNVGNDVQPSERKYVDTITEVRNFIASGCSLPGRATTQEILTEFRTRLPVNDSAIFREMLRKICDFDRGLSGEGFWILKPEFT
jgi:DNA excision repair protein ERCC-6